MASTTTTSSSLSMYPSPINALFILSVYLFFAVFIYLCNPDDYSGVKTISAVDALYFAVNTLCTVGYRDITPLTPNAKMLFCLIIPFGFGIFRVVLPRAFNCYLHDQERSMMAEARRRGLSGKSFDFENDRIRTSLKVIFAIGGVVVSIGSGMLGLYFLEEFDVVDSFYISVVSVTTVGYGSRAFKTVSGRMFASIWLLLSTLAFARSFMFLTKLRFQPRNLGVTRI